MDDRDEQLRQYLSTKYLTTPPEEVTPASVTTTADDNTQDLTTESTPGDHKAEAVKNDGYANASDSSGVKSAQNSREWGDLIAGVGRGVTQMVTAQGQGVGFKPEYSGSETLEKVGKDRVDEAQAARQNSIKDYLTKRQMTREDKSDVMAGETHQLAQQRGQQELKGGEQSLQQGALNLKTSTDHQDPASKDSQLAVAMVDKQFPKLLAGMSPEQRASLTYDDIKNLGLSAAETGAKIDATTEAARARLQQTLELKNQEQDKALGTQYTTRTQKYNGDSAKLAGEENMLAQAKQGSGIAGNLVKSEALKQALGRVTQSELSMGQNPGLVNAVNSFLQRTEGKALTDQDLKDYEHIMADARKTLDSTYHADVGTLTDVHDRTTHRPAGYSASLLGYKGPAPVQAPGGGQGGAGAPTPTPIAEGSTSTSRGRPIVYRNGKWELQ